RELDAQRRIRCRGSQGLSRWRRGPTPQFTAEPYLMPRHLTGHSALVSEHALGLRCQEHACTGDYAGRDLALAVASPPTVAVGIVSGTGAPERRLRTVHVPSVLIGAPLHRHDDAFIEAAAGYSYHLGFVAFTPEKQPPPSAGTRHLRHGRQHTFEHERVVRPGLTIE